MKKNNLLLIALAIIGLTISTIGQVNIVSSDTSICFGDSIILSWNIELNGSDTIIMPFIPWTIEGDSFEYNYNTPPPGWQTTVGGWNLGTLPFIGYNSGPVPPYTWWPVGTDIYLRKELDLTYYNLDLIEWFIAVDNGYTFFINGTQISSGWAAGNGWEWEYSGIINPSLLNQGSNIIAVIPSDEGVANYFNIMLKGIPFPSNYLWSTGETDDSITVYPAESTTYYGQVTIGNVTYSDSIVITVQHCLEVELKEFLEGPFFTSQMTPWLNIFGYLPLTQPYNYEPWNYPGTESVPAIPNLNVIDWVLVELRETTGDANDATSSTIVARRAGFILRNGSIVGLDGINNIIFDLIVTDNLYVVIWHRNHLNVMSAYPVILSGGVYPYDFTSGSDKVLGGTLAHKQIGTGIWGMISGNGIPDDQLDNNDKDDVWKLQCGNSGFKSGDFNMNGQVNSDDEVMMWEPNAGKSSKVPQ